LKEGRFVAAMAVHSKDTRQWSPGEVELVQQVASRCWESIERARVEREREGLLEAAEAANRAKDEFLAMLGHELRNPLAPILTALQLMRLRGDISSERERTVIERQVRHLTRLVDDLLDVSRIARGKVELKRELVELSQIVSQAIEVASPLLERRAHELVLNVPQTGLAVEGDAARLTQVVSNLLTNAGKYTPSGGRVTIAGAAEGDQVVLRVRDTGVGIASETLDHVFDLFVQGQQSIDRAQGGLGLGLTIVKNLVERHAGSVSAYSEGTGKGSEFVVRLPRAHEPAEHATDGADSGVTSSSDGVRGARILIVDDNEDAAEMLASALTLQGCDVHVAHDGPSALRVAASGNFDAAMLDIGLPVMDGYELAARLRELPNLTTTCLVAVTGYGQESDRRRALAAGFQHHLVKPVDLEALKSIVLNLRSARDRTVG
jgi:signal transduction histidine kinase/ActR/RegA family two-component response regulator